MTEALVMALDLIPTQGLDRPRMPPARRRAAPRVFAPARPAAPPEGRTYSLR